MKEFTAGLRSQPDYIGALVARACAYARQGDIEHALADAKRARATWRMVEKAAPGTDGINSERAEFETMVSELELALQSAPTMPSDAPCTETYDPAIERRERSKLFEPAS